MEAKKKVHTFQIWKETSGCMREKCQASEVDCLPLLQNDLTFLWSDIEMEKHTVEALYLAENVWRPD